MHNLHLVVVKAETGEEACSDVETYISDWGSEDNWRTMCGAVSEDNEIYKAGDGRFEPNEDDTIDKINTMVADWMKESYYSHSAKEALAQGKKIEDFNTNELYSLERYAKDLYQIKRIEEMKAYRKEKGDEVSDTFNVLKDDYYGYEYDQCGVTQLDTGGEGKTWVVFLDMHS